MMEARMGSATTPKGGHIAEGAGEDGADEMRLQDQVGINQSQRLLVMQVCRCNQRDALVPIACGKRVGMAPPHKFHKI